MAIYKVDNVHSLIEFSVKHMMVSKVKGRFDSFSAKVEADSITNLTNASIQFTIDVASINTRNEDRDNHLKSPDFFDIENHKTIDFVTTEITSVDKHFQVTGDLTIKGITKLITFNVTYGGKGIDPWGKEVYGYSATTIINREDFGLTWNTALETGGVLVGKDIEINIDLEINPE